MTMTNYTNTWYIYIYICIQNHNDDTIMKTSDSVLRKIYLSLYLKGLCMRGSWRPNRTATYWPPHFTGHNRVSFPFSWAAQPEARGPSSQLGAVFSTASFLQLFWSPNWLIGGLRAPSAGCWLYLPHLVSNWSGLQNWLNFPCLSYIIVQHPPSSCGRHKLHSFNPSTVKVILCYSSTGCTCYLHRRISYFDSPAGS